MSWVVALLLFGGVCALWSFAHRGGRAKESTPKLRGGSFAPIQSLTDDERQYECSAALLECTCPDFAERRHEFPKDDARRLCKHLVQVLGKEGWPEAFRHERTVLQACRNRKRGFPVYGRRGVFSVNKATYQIFWAQHETEWVDIYERDRWGYNTSERRWAYNDKPRHAGQLACHLLGLEPILPDSTSTVSLVHDGDEYHWIALGDLDGVRSLSKYGRCRVRLGGQDGGRGQAT